MIRGIGIDIFDMSRMEPLIGDLSDPFFKATFTEAEIQKSLEKSDKLKYLCERFSAKEATIKCLYTDLEGVSLKDMEVLNDDYGRPFVNINGALKGKIAELGIKSIHISISQEGNLVIAMAISET